jgi:outer membrane protein OmpA-like peptidoglycan-associated protein/tetratricopeptide (TPR) repeat protein
MLELQFLLDSSTKIRYMSVTRYTHHFSRFLIVILLTGLWGVSYSQLSNSSRSDLEQAVRVLFNEQRYAKALPYLFRLDSLEGEHPEYWYKTGIACLHAPRHKDKALTFLKKYEASAPEDSDYLFYMGRTYHLDTEFEKAITYYQKFIDSLSTTNSRKKSALTYIEQCRNGQQLNKKRPGFKVVNLDSPVNTRYDEYAPVISADGSKLAFTTRYPKNKGGSQNQHGFTDPSGHWFEDIYIAHKVDNQRWSSPQNIDDNINTSNHDATVALSPDGQQLYFYKSDGKKWGNLYTSELDGGKWQYPGKLPPIINTEYWEGSASVTPGRNEIYFVSNRPGGEGGKDIYRAKRQPNGSWSAPQNLGPTVNTPGDEESPFIHADKHTLYFSSEGHNSMGGFDVFMTCSDSMGWSQPRNLGRPVNTPDDDLHFVLNGSGQTGYYTSARQGGNGALDIYKVTLPSQFHPQPVMLISGQVCGNGVPVNSEIYISDNATGEILYTTNSNSLTGSYMVIVSEPGDYNIAFTHPNYLFTSRNIGLTLQDTTQKEELNVDLTPILPESPVVQKDLYFLTGSDALEASSFVKLRNIKRLLQHNASLKTHLTLYIDSTPHPANGVIAQHRLNAFTDYMHSQGIDTQRIGSKQIIVNAAAVDTLHTTHFIRMKVFKDEHKVLEAQSVPTEQMFTLDSLPEKVGEQTVLQDLHFEFGRTELTDTSHAVIRKLYQHLKAHPQQIVEISAHTDSIASSAYNRWLSGQRAQTVVDCLVQRGIAQKRLIPKGYGESQPIATNVTTEGRQLNRRAAFKLIRIEPMHPLLQEHNYTYRQLVEQVGDKKVPELRFKIQLGAFRDSVPAGYFGNLPDSLHPRPTYSYEDQLLKYQYGSIKTLVRAEALRQQFLEKGYEDAWVVPLYHRVRVKQLEKYYKNHLEEIGQSQGLTVQK